MQSVKQLGWALLLWGVLSVIFGILILAWPGITLKVFLIILGIYLFASGIVLTVGSVMHREGSWVGGILLGILSVIAGAYVFANPQISALVALSLLAIWAIVVGTVQVIAGIEQGKHGIWLAIGGVILVLFGFFVFTNPREGAIAFIWAIGLINVFNGIMLIIASFNADKLPKKIESWS